MGKMIINQDNYVDTAQNVINRLVKRVEEGRTKKGPRVSLVTTSKIRNLLAMTSDIYNQVINIHGDCLDPQICEQIEYLRVRVIYEVGRGDDSVRDFIREAKILEILKEIRNSKKNFLLFSRYMEALVAFHRFYGGKDN